VLKDTDGAAVLNQNPTSMPTQLDDNDQIERAESLPLPSIVNENTDMLIYAIGGVCLFFLLISLLVWRRRQKKMHTSH